MSGLTPTVVYYARLFAHSTVTNQWTEFTVQFTATATPIRWINGPVHIQAVTQPFQFAGWAIDASAPTWTGVSAVDIWSYPNPGSGTAPLYVGSGAYGVARTGVAAAGSV